MRQSSSPPAHHALSARGSSVPTYYTLPALLSAALRAAAAQLRMPSLTCGLSGADTFTMSSWQRDRAVISLLRPLTAFDGTVVEPFELPAAFEIPPDPFDLLACAAVYVMLGESCPFHQLDLWNLP